MRLSICIPTHDGRREQLREAVESVLTQSKDGVEICISDNASEDGTQEDGCRAAR